MDDAHAQLSSAATSLDELIDRLVSIADAHRDRPSDDLSAELDEIERSLRSAARKLDRLVHRRH
jgi:hypothetical protein